MPWQTNLENISALAADRCRLQQSKTQQPLADKTMSIMLLFVKNFAENSLIMQFCRKTISIMLLFSTHAA